MSLSPNEIKARAARFADSWRDAHYEKGETHSFYNEFFEIFGVNRRRVASYEEPVKLLGNTLRANIDETESAAIITEQGGQENHRERSQNGSSFWSQFA